MTEIAKGSPNLNITNDSTPVSDGNIALGCVIQFVILVIVLENTLMLLTIKLYKPWKVVDLLVLSLSLADLFNAMFPLQILNIKGNFLPGPAWSSWLCGVFVWATYCLRIASLSTVTLMSVEQALLLNQPLRYYTQITFSFMRRLVFLTWAISALAAVLPKLLMQTTTENARECRYLPFHFGLAFGIFIEGVGLIQFVVVLGSLVTLFCSSKLFLERQRTMVSSQDIQVSTTNVSVASSPTSAQRRNNARRETQGMVQVKQLCRVMGYVVLLYYITWLPFLVYNLYSLLCPRPMYNRQMVIIVGICTLATPVLNPLLYIKMVNRYRKGVVHILRRVASVCGRNRSLNNSFGSSQRFSLETQRSSSSSSHLAISWRKGNGVEILSASKINKTTLVEIVTH